MTLPNIKKVHINFATKVNIKHKEEPNVHIEELGTCQRGLNSHKDEIKNPHKRNQKQTRETQILQRTN